MSSADKRHIEIIVIGARKGEDASLIDLIIKKNDLYKTHRCK